MLILILILILKFFFVFLIFISYKFFGINIIIFSFLNSKPFLHFFFILLKKKNFL
jgi:hypothetical protein